MTTSNKIPVPNYVAFDTETTGLVPEQDHIIEVGLVKFHNGEPIDRWTSLIKPQGKVGLKTLRLTGIALEDLEDGALLSDVCAEIEKFRGDLPLVGHNPEFDAAFLSKSIPGFPGVLVYDTLELARIVYPGFKTYKLSDLAQNLNIILNDAHRACDDAEASGILFRLIQERIMSMSTS
ncbi:MAG TPA: 3'-5' exonuclease, partial [Bacillota bacterium]|nr:3'-5' exonuclease [Bacillota bacterium]